jgi:hypothetical protein
VSPFLTPEKAARFACLHAGVERSSGTIEMPKLAFTFSRQSSPRAKARGGAREGDKLCVRRLAVGNLGQRDLKFRDA